MTCPECEGKGWKRIQVKMEPGSPWEINGVSFGYGYVALCVPCPICNGTGEVEEKDERDAGR